MLMWLLACTLKETHLSVDMESTSFGCEANEFVITIDSSSPWTIGFDDWWVTFSKTSGPAGVSEVTASMKANTSLKTRCDVLTVSAGDKQEKITLT